MMLRSGRKHTRDRGGALTVEFALVLPIMGLLLAALMEFGHFYMVVHTLNAAARRGAHLGCHENVTTAQVEDRVKGIVGAAVAATAATVRVADASVFDSANMDPKSVNFSTLPTVELSTRKTGDCYMVQVTVPYDNVALLPPFWLKGRTVIGRAVTRHE